MTENAIVKKPKRKMAAASLANLRPYKKGPPGAEGRRPLAVPRPVTEALRKKLNCQLPDNVVGAKIREVYGLPKTATWLEAMVCAQIYNAAVGRSLPSFQEITDRLEGALKQELDVTGDPTVIAAITPPKITVVFEDIHAQLGYDPQKDIDVEAMPVKTNGNGPENPATD